jgi:hypothetical protein
MSANMKALKASETPGGAALVGGVEQLEKLGCWDALVYHDPQRRANRPSQNVTDYDFQPLPMIAPDIARSA